MSDIQQLQSELSIKEKELNQITSAYNQKKTEAESILSQELQQIENKYQSVLNIATQNIELKKQNLLVAQASFLKAKQEMAEAQKSSKDISVALKKAKSDFQKKRVTTLKAINGDYKISAAGKMKEMKYCEKKIKALQKIM